MIDFKKLRASKFQSTTINPIEIFERSPKPQGIKDLYGSQSKVLESWFDRRNEKDIVIKLPTGGGKTLVGLLIAKSLLNEHNEPVLYITPDNQLAEQIYAKANEYPFFSDSAEMYKKGQDFPDSFLSGKKILIANYSALFNSKSKFGVKGSPKEIIKASSIILDDAHVAFSKVRDSFTLSIDRSKLEEEYKHITNIFRYSFEEMGRVGTFDDVIKGNERNIVLDVPYWSWLDQSEVVRSYLSSRTKSFLFTWEFLRDNFKFCHCLISSRSVAITPFFPLVDLVPSFSDCPRRIFMSATINDDSSIMRTFDAKKDLVANPITSESSVGISERMILVPDWMNMSYETKNTLPQLIQGYSKKLANEKGMGCVILVPSSHAAKEYKNIAKVAENTDEVSLEMKKLQSLESFGPVAFANRYDGIDLQGDSCRLLILDGLPRGSSEYDTYLSSVFAGGFAFNSIIAQRIEQGMGRGARGTDDYCVILILGKELTAWLSRSANIEFLTSPTLAQFKMGEEISRDIKDENDLLETIDLCFQRNEDWTKYHAETLSENLSYKVGNSDLSLLSLDYSSLERKVFQLFRDRYHEKAISKLTDFLATYKDIDEQTKGWLNQLAAKIAYSNNQKDLSQQYQQAAYANNRALLKPQVNLPYTPIPIPSKQAEEIIKIIEQYRPKRGFLSCFDEVASHLVPEASANQFEQALSDFGQLLGFATERPEKNRDGNKKQGPDILFLLENHGFIIEAKSEKEEYNPLTKKDFGQLLSSVEWFKSKYPQCSYTPISILHNANSTNSIVINDTKALTYDSLRLLISESRQFFEEICTWTISSQEAIIRCEQQLQNSNLQLDSIIQKFLSDFS